MKTLIICILCSISIQAQTYTFENIIQQNTHEYKILDIKGQVSMQSDRIILSTIYGDKTLHIIGEIPFYLQGTTIYRCIDDNQNLIRLIWLWTEDQRKYVDMIYSPQEDITLTFCLIKKIQE